MTIQIHSKGGHNLKCDSFFGYGETQRSSGEIDWDFFQFLASPSKKDPSLKILKNVREIYIRGNNLHSLQQWAQDGTPLSTQDILQKKSVVWGFKKNILRNDHDTSQPYLLCGICGDFIQDDLAAHMNPCSHFVHNECVKYVSYYCFLCKARVFDDYVYDRLVSADQYIGMVGELKQNFGFRNDICIDFLKKKYGVFYSRCAHGYLRPCDLSFYFGKLCKMFLCDCKTKKLYKT